MDDFSTISTIAKDPIHFTNIANVSTDAGPSSNASKHLNQCRARCNYVPSLLFHKRTVTLLFTILIQNIGSTTEKHIIKTPPELHAHVLGQSGLAQAVQDLFGGLAFPRRVQSVRTSVRERIYHLPDYSDERSRRIYFSNALLPEKPIWALAAVKITRRTTLFSARGISRLQQGDLRQCPEKPWNKAAFKACDELPPVLVNFCLIFSWQPRFLPAPVFRLDQGYRLLPTIDNMSHATWSWWTHVC